MEGKRKCKYLREKEKREFEMIQKRATYGKDVNKEHKGR